MNKLAKHYYHILESLRALNFRGKPANDEFIERDLGMIHLPQGDEIGEVLNELESKNLLLRYKYVDESLLVLNEEICIRRVLENYVQNEEGELKTLPSTTTNEVQKQRYILTN